METAVSDSSASVFSPNIPPAPTGRPSVSYSSCRAVPTEPTSACQPEMAPHAMVTKSIGHSGCHAWPASNPKPRSLTAGSANAPMRLPAMSFVPRSGAAIIPTALSTMVISMTQKPM